MTASIAVVGVGPRGVSIIDRIGALMSMQTDTQEDPQSTALESVKSAESTAKLELHLIDDSQLGAGRIWNTEQTRTLCMNTLADAVTLFTEPNSSVTAPVRPGPHV